MKTKHETSLEDRFNDDVRVAAFSFVFYLLFIFGVTILSLFLIAFLVSLFL